MGASCARKILAAVVLTIFAASSVSAEMAAKQFIANYDTGDIEVKRLYGKILGSQNGGLEWANSFLIKMRNDVQIFCTPDKVALTDDQLVDILRRYIKANTSMAEYPFGLSLMYAMRDAFPCK